ncbi:MULTISPECIES: hypothetical protein [Helicobacter]|uniref:Uncharacterized protein n=1 Tax=Helicobacter bilis ATCC 43879 TaxID=613026 RepID=C3XJ50_9HELI|nr:MULTISPECIES: hypothetical protein [Helicobacter]EEO25039.2 hypothetical protein HRAG_02096 [Helicobacter bilis ATCC 43879]
MDLETLGNMGDEEMAGKIVSIVAIIKVLGNNMLGRILSSPLKFAKLIKFSLKVKKEADKIQDKKDMGDKIDSSVAMAKMILEYRKTNPNEMETLFEILEEMVQKYQTNPDIKQDILNLIEKNGK